MILAKSEREDLLRLAREAIEESLDPHLHASSQGAAKKKALQTRCGAFVSLYVNDELRGCIGTFSEDEPVYRNVKKMAVSAATTDTRFSPILPEELDRLAIEISVLTPRTRIYDISEIIIGKHGIYMTRGLNRGTLLPQVAVTQNWNAEELLGNCSRYKAGIGWEGWKTAELYTYQALIFRSPALINVKKY
jgi:AmmeMemoRadiSam system protein A